MVDEHDQREMCCQKMGGSFCKQILSTFLMEIKCIPLTRMVNSNKHLIFGLLTYISIALPELISINDLDNPKLYLYALIIINDQYNVKILVIRLQ